MSMSNPMRTDFSPPELAFHFAASVGYFDFNLPQLLNYHRALGQYIDSLQPGVINPLPDDSPDLVDAMRVIDEADKIRKELQCE